MPASDTTNAIHTMGPTLTGRVAPPPKKPTMSPTADDSCPRMIARLSHRKAATQNATEAIWSTLSAPMNCTRGANRRTAIRAPAANGNSAAPSHVRPNDHTEACMPTELTVTAAKNESTSSAVARPMTIHSRSVNGPRPCCAFDGGWVAGCS